MEREIIGKPARIDALRPLLRFYQRSGMQKLLRKSGLFGKTKLILLEAQLPRIDKPYSLPGEQISRGHGKQFIPLLDSHAEKSACSSVVWHD